MKTPRNLLSTLRLIIVGLLTGIGSHGLAQQVQTLYATPSDLSTVTWRDAYNGASGCEFTVGSSNVVVSHLGYFSTNVLGLNSNHYVGILSDTVPPQLLAQVIVPGTNSLISPDAYTNSFYWMPLDPPFLLLSNTTYYVATLPYANDGDWWGDTFAANFNPFFVGTTIDGIQAPASVYGPGDGSWPPGGFSLQNSATSNTTYLIEGLANLPIDQARVNVQSTNIGISVGQTLTINGFASGAPTINYQWWMAPNTRLAGQTTPTLIIPNATTASSGTYYLTASNSLGGEQSANVTVTVTASPVGFSQSPTNTSMFQNYPVKFSCVATGTPPVSLQWLRNSSAISGATSNSYSFFTSATNNGNVYACFGSNNVEGTPYTATSSSATLTVMPNLAYPQEFLHGPPTGAPRTSGTQICGGCIAVASTPVIVTHLGFDATVLTTPALIQDHRVGIWLNSGAAGYPLLGWVTVTNGTPTNGAINGYLWMPLNPPLVLSPNTGYIVAAETFAGGDQYNDTTAVADWNPYFTPGVTNSAVWGTVTFPTAPTSGFYGGQMYGAANMAILTNVSAVYVSNAPVASPNFSGFVNNVTNVVGTSLSFLGYAEGQPPLAYPQWYLNGAPLANQTNANLAIPSLTPGNAGNYYLVVSNYQNSLTVTSSVVDVTVLTNPVIVNQYPNTYTNILNTNFVTLYAGANANFSVSVLGASPFHYQWFVDGGAVGGATNAGYQLTNAQPASPTNFFCIVTNIYGSATSAVWITSVIADPTNSTGGPALYPQTVLSLNPIGYWRMNDTNLDGPDNGSGDDGYVCHDYVSGNDGIYTNAIIGQPGYDPILDPSDSSAEFGLLSLTDGDANSIGGIDFSSPTGTSKAFTVEAWVNGYGQSKDAGIITKGWGGGGEQFNLDTGTDPGHYFRFFIRDASGATHLVNTTNAPDGNWHHLAAVVDEISSQTVTLYFDGQNVGSAVVTNGSGILSTPTLMSIGSRMSSQTVTNLDDQFVGYINDVAIFNHALSASQVLNEYLVGAQVAPYSTNPPPASLTVVAGAPLSFPTIAFGSPVLGYTWVNTSTSTVLASGTGTINGTTLTAGYATNNTPADWNGQTLQLTITNAYGTANYSVTLTVTLAPVIVTDLPPAVTEGLGQNYAYSIGAVGEAPLAYQWYEGGSAVSGATNATYTPPSSSVGTNTVYVVVTNNYGSVTSVMSSFSVIAPPNTPLAAAIGGMNPVAYWPMHEVEPAAPGDIETNYGTLGVLGNAYYPDWAGDAGAVSAFQRGFSSAIASDGDPSLYFTGFNSSTGSTTNSIYIPHTSPATTLNPPFTVELWVYPTGAQNDIWSQSGFEGLNAGNMGGGGGAVCGIRLYGGNGGFTVYSYNNSSGLNGPLSLGSGIPNNQWCHVVVTCDVHTNISMFTNGVQALTTTNYTGLYSPDYWTPFQLANGRGDTRATRCGIDEVAIYTNALSATQVSTHYQTGINPAPATSYFATITNDNPVVYLRMDAPAYTPPSLSTWPPLYNFGSVVGNGVYTPGTVPGILPGPSTNYLSVNQGTNVALLSGVSSFADAGYNPVWDPSAPNGTSNEAFSVVCSFRGNPGDNRFQCLVGHSDNSWRMTLGANAAGGGAAGSVQFTYGAGVSSTISCNDGKWHQAVGVYTPGSTTSEGTVSLYVDGRLNAVNTAVSSNGITAGAPNYDVMLGAAPDYTNQDLPPHAGTPFSLGRQFAGQLCDVAVFTNALTPAQVQSLYLAAGGVQQALSISSYLPVTSQTHGTTNLMTLYPGASPSLLVNVSGSPVYYRWYINGVAVGGGTNAVLTLPNVQNGTTAFCVATNNNNSVTSVVWSASIVANPDPAGSFSQTVMSDSPMAYWRLNEAAGSTVAIDYAGGANGVYGNQTTNGVPGVPIIASGGERSVSMDPAPTTMPQGTVTNAGIVLNTNTVTFVCWVLPTSLASTSNPAGLFQNRSTANSSGFQLNESLSPSPLDYNWGGSSSAYNYGNPYGIPTNQWGMAVLEITPQNAQFYVYSGTNGVVGIATNNFNSQIESFFGVNYIGADPNGGTGRILHGQMNELAIFNYQLSQAQLNALYQSATNGAVAAPLITSQPQNATVAVGTARTSFTSGASSFVQPLSYQWYYNTSSNYTGATALANGLQANGSWATNVTTAQLTITNLTFGAAGYYFLAVGNSVGTSDSAIASLVVTPVTTPTNIVVSSASGQLTLSWPYNWTGWRLEGNTNIAGSNWVPVAGSSSTNQVVIPIYPTNASEFYRLIYP